VQAKVWCTTNKAKKVVVGLTLLTLTEAAAFIVIYNFHLNVSVLHIFYVVNHAVVPATILIINLIVVYKVRRSSHYAATNLGLQHQQSTSSSSAVPTVTLVTTSLVYVALLGTRPILYVAYIWVDQRFKVYVVSCYQFSAALVPLVFAYNFFVYLITSKQFRSGLHKLFCSCSSFSLFYSSSATDAGTVRRRGQADTAI